MTESVQKKDTNNTDRLRDALLSEDAGFLEAFFEDRAPSEALREFLLLTPEERDQAFHILPLMSGARLIQEAPKDLAVDLIERLSPAKSAALLEELKSDQQADVIAELSDVDAEAVLSEMPSEEAAEVRRLTTYSSDTAGGLMVAEAFTFEEGATVGLVLRTLASDDEEFEKFRGQHPYVVDAEERLIGVVSLRSLLTAKRSTKLPDVMAEPVTVATDTSLSDLEDYFDDYAFLGAPVVDEDGVLVGVVARSAVAAASLERSESESLKRQGIVGDELRSMPTWTRAKRRLAWLSTNIVLNIAAASIISAYEQTLALVIALATFLPMVSDMSGCSGNQAVGVTMRELSLGLVRPVDAARVWLKEVSVGVINGLALGILIGLVAWLWKGNVALGVVIGTALALNTVLAVSLGGVIPLLLKRMGQDPAAASGPLLTTITDMAGFFLVLSLATVLMPWLV